jgi:hypothetical protein
MARGWESKAIESQQQEPIEVSPAAGPGDPAARQRQAERQTLLLARLKALSDLQHACAPPHRAMLEQAVEDLDRRIADLG